MPLHTHLFSFTHNAVVLSAFRCVHPENQTKIFSIFTFYESKQMSLTQDLRWSLGRSIALQLQRQTDLLLCTINCFLQWDHLPNMALRWSSLLLYSISMVCSDYCLHILIPLTGYVGLVTQYRCGYCKSQYLWGHYEATLDTTVTKGWEATMHAVVSSTLIVPSSVLWLAVVTAVLCNMRPL